MSEYIWEKSQEEKIKDEQPTKISQLENDLPEKYPPSEHEHSEYLRNDGGRISGIYSNGKRFYNILNYLYPARATSGFKIKTNIPEKSTKMVTLKLLGYDYGGSTPVDMSVVFYTYSSGIINLGACSASAFKPPITLAVENGKIVVFIEGNLYFFNFALDAYVHNDTDESFFEDWSVVVDEEISGNATEIKTVPYRE